MDVCGDALMGVTPAHGNRFDCLELAEEIFDQMAPFVDFSVDRQRLGAPWML